jgi:hypothetical protein
MITNGLNAAGISLGLTAVMGASLLAPGTVICRMPEVAAFCGAGVVMGLQKILDANGLEIFHDVTNKELVIRKAMPKA